MSLQVEVFDDSHWARSTAERFEELTSSSPKANICLPTGDTVKPLYAEIARRGGLADTTVFLLDEFGGLPADSPARCESMLRRDLLELLTDPPTFHLPDVDAPDSAAAAASYGSRVAAAGLNLALLGLGVNGHIGMNEPGSGADSPTRVVQLAESTADHAVEAYGGETRPRWGITIGLAALLEAEQVWLLVTGSHKAEILRRTLEGAIGPDIPATFLRQHPRLRVFADQSAASLLRTP